MPSVWGQVANITKTFSIIGKALVHGVVNGAVTAAFANMYNKWSQKQQSQCLAAAVTACGVGAATGSEIGAPVGCAAGGPACPATGTAGAIVGGAAGCLVGGGAALAMCAVGNSLSQSTGTTVHGNSSRSQRPTEVYYLINRSSGVIDKIGITSNPQGRYSQPYLQKKIM